MNEIANICDMAFIEGKTINLNNIVYGPANWAKNGFSNNTSSYYYFLAGICQLMNFTKIIEVGTHFGGSTQSMYEGIKQSSEFKIVTIDVTSLNNEGLAKNNIFRIIGNGEENGVQNLAIDELGGNYCDLLYIDALKDKNFVLNVLNGFLEKITIRVVILDDISICNSMRDMWKKLEKRYGEYALDVSKINAKVRDPKVGFGIICLDKNILKNFSSNNK